MPKLKAHWDNDIHGNSILIVEKARGKITVDELAKFLLYDFRIYGHYVIHINASETCAGGNGWYFEEPKGDSQFVYQVEPDGICPICTKLSPPDYCPGCGEKIKCAHCGHEIIIK